MSDIQKQLEIRDLVDTTPLREKLLEVKNWEKSMKQKEKDLKASNKVETNESVPIRSRIKENGQATDPATSDPPTVNGNGIQDNKNEALKLAQERSLSIKLAHEEKERGNKLVAAKDYSSAIPHYSKAIELNANDPAFFLNRALCHLRLDDFNSAIADCDSALKLDKSLTKAHFRRMQSHIKLAKYDEALGDCIQMIKLDPKNPDLRKEFDRIKQLKIDKDNGGKAPSAVVGKPKSAEESYWEPRVQKLWSKFGPDEEEIRFQDKAPHLRSKKPLKRISITETFTAPEPVETFPDHIVDKIFNNFTGESTSDGPAASSSRSPVALFSPYTPLYGSFNAPKSPVIPTPPSPMSSSALNLSSCSADRSIDDIFGGITIASKDKPDQDEEPMVLGCQPPPDLELQSDKTDAMKPVVSSPPTPNRPARSFEIPKTGVQFADVWKGLDELERFQFLRQCQGGSKIVGQLDASLDDSLFSELLDTMHSYFCPKDLNIGDMLVQLSRNSEIGILAMMMGDIERRTVEDLLNYVKGRQELTPEVLTDLERAFSG